MKLAYESPEAEIVDVVTRDVVAYDDNPIPLSQMNPNA